MRKIAPLRGSCAGFTYVGLIILMAIIGLVGAATLKVHTLLQRAAAERELLEIGAEYQEAFRSYAAATPQGQLNLPKSLDDLLLDSRAPIIVRHLRKVYVDPVTGSKEWGEIKSNGFLVAIHSQSKRRPLKQKNFDMRFRGFDNRERISDWRFGTVVQTPAGQNPSTTGTLPPGPGGTTEQETLPVVGSETQ
jgi:type II secretory pathway pseudopilin PulG